ncbi:TetR family transcriptional regulator [Paracidovorax konjaci]|uniref:Transcriptional regulator, TetR family n=1 Tax=Paracidovorax konjaci TaxID=32040 RepID=A0A1I1WMA9_9BURK|nr:TetR family transcriptional regulator [Paracidovorax konjaci]SFD95528.1 transcriptional regulator, TetR family [Paracidovorax konjaci]
MARKSRLEAQATHRKILDAAERVYLQEGAGCSVSRIAEEARVTRGAIYWYFKNRDDLLRCVADRLEGGWKAAYASRAIDIYSNPMTNLQAMAEQMLERANEDPQLQTMVRASTRLVACSPATVSSYQGCLKREWTRAVSLGMVRDDLDVDTATLGLLTLTAGLVKHWADSGQSFDLMEVGHNAVQAYLEGWLPASINSRIAWRLAQQFTGQA